MAWSRTRSGRSTCGALPEPDTFLDVTDTFETKLEALSKHRSQVEQGWELREVRARSRYADVGKRIGVQYAEAFKRIEVF